MVLGYRVTHVTTHVRPFGQLLAVLDLICTRNNPIEVTLPIQMTPTKCHLLFDNAGQVPSGRPKCTVNNRTACLYEDWDCGVTTVNKETFAPVLQLYTKKHSPLFNYCI